MGKGLVKALRHRTERGNNITQTDIKLDYQIYTHLITAC